MKRFELLLLDALRTRQYRSAFNGPLDLPPLD